MIALLENIEDEEDLRSQQENWKNYGICLHAYEGCEVARDSFMFDRICSQPNKYVNCILNDSGLIDIPRGGQK